jgi:hypothetical protein
MRRLEAISTDTSRATVRVIRTDEELMIARSVCRALELGNASKKRNSDHATEYISRLDPFSAGGVPAARWWGVPRCGHRQPTFPRPSCSGQPPRGKTHTGFQNPAEKTQRKLVASPRRHNVTLNEHDAKAILPEPRSVKKQLPINNNNYCHHTIGHITTR